MSAPVFLAEPGALDGFGPGHSYLLDGAEGRHAGVVQRRSVGEPLDVVDGRGVRLCAEVAAVSADGVRLTVRECVREAPAPVELVLVQALAKGDRGEAAIEAATELGVDEVVPWQAERSVVQWRGPRAEHDRKRRTEVLSTQSPHRAPSHCRLRVARPGHRQSTRCGAPRDAPH